MFDVINRFQQAYWLQQSRWCGEIEQTLHNRIYEMFIVPKSVKHAGVIFVEINVRYT